MMLDLLLRLDTNLFLFINHLPHNLVLDYFFGALTFLGEAGAIWFFLSFLLSLKYQPQKRWSFVAKIYAVGFFSLLLIFVLKQFFDRVRPEFVLQNVILPFGPDFSFSFPSGHALTSFVFAALLDKLGKLGKLEKGLIYGLAVFISFSRLYLGYHYPLDVVGGAIIGIIVAKITIKILIPRQTS